MYYYRIYDDNEELNFFRSSIDNKKIEEYLREFELQRQRFSNPDFIDFLKKRDVDAEIITINNLSY
ncbi:MAG TPA: hypothetical protein DCP63_11070 [Bacteroidetes bacterium]|nr:hypothetical protein [Bacteroidota bacterium]